MALPVPYSLALTLLEILPGVLPLGIFRLGRISVSLDFPQKSKSEESPWPGSLI
jgi:hypothetical protein